MGDDRPGVYQEGRRGKEIWVYRASTTGDCLRALVAMAHMENEARGQKRETMLMEAAERGNEYEEAVCRFMEELGWVFETRQQLVEIQVLPGVITRGHTDGVAIHPETGQRHGVEVKSMSPGQFAKWTRKGFGEFRKYGFQVSTYMQYYDPPIPFIYPVIERTNEERPGSGDHYARVVELWGNGRFDPLVIPANQPPIPFTKIKGQIMKAESWRKRSYGQYPECDIKDKWFCPFWYLHGEDGEESGIGQGEISDEIAAVLKDLLGKRQEFYPAIKAGKDADDERRKVDAEILNLMGGVDQVGIAGDDKQYNITVVRYFNERADVKKLREKFGEEVEEFISGSEVKYPKVTEKVAKASKATKVSVKKSGDK